jgi:hypothetical protein
VRRISDLRVTGDLVIAVDGIVAPVLDAPGVAEGTFPWGPSRRAGTRSVALTERIRRSPLKSRAIFGAYIVLKIEEGI